MPQGMGALNEKMGIELAEISAERVVATMPVEGNTQPYGLLHGGASVVLAETLGSVGSASTPTPTSSRSASTSTPPTTGPRRRARSPASRPPSTSAARRRRTRSSSPTSAASGVCTSRITCALIPRGAFDG